MAKLSKSSSTKTKAKPKVKKAFSKGGSTVNAAGNAQMVAKAYKAAGGGYKS